MKSIREDINRDSVFVGEEILYGYDYIKLHQTAYICTGYTSE